MFDVRCSSLFQSRLGAEVAKMTGTEHTEKQSCQICPVPLFHVTGSHHLFLNCFADGVSRAVAPAPKLTHVDAPLALVPHAHV